jgi:putative addiction module component (TIGR02574 family)
MGSSASHILESALALPEEDRRRVAEALLDSVPRDSADDVETAWRDEVMRRIEEVRQGEVEPEPWTEVKKHIRAALDR